MERMNFMNTQIDNVTMAEAVKEIKDIVKKGEPSYVVTPNVDHIVQLESDEVLKKVYKNADLILADGKPLIWISKIYKRPIKEKVSGSDLFPKICEMAAETGYSMFFLGAGEGIARKAADNLQDRYKGLKIVGTHSPSFGFEKNEEEVERIIELIKSKDPDILIVGLGCPKQEKFIFNYYREYNVPISLGLGASLDFEAKTAKRAPKWMSDNGLEWLYRLVKEPKRMFKRYIVNDSKIIGLMFKYRNKVG